VTADGAVAWLEVLAVSAVVVSVAAAVVAVVVDGVVEATFVTAVLDGVAAVAAPIDPVCQMAPNARAKVAREVAAMRRRIIAIRRARASSRARTVVCGVSIGGMPAMLGPACERRLGEPWEVPQSRSPGGGGGPFDRAAGHLVPGSNTCP
jgi:hypothetical protein